jgi:hypothetical protein
MLSAIHTKIPLASLTALIAIVVAVAYQARESEKPAAAAPKRRPFSNGSNATPRSKRDGTRNSDNESRKTRSGTTLPLRTRARPGRRTFPRSH